MNPWTRFWYNRRVKKYGVSGEVSRRVLTKGLVARCLPKRVQRWPLVHRVLVWLDYRGGRYVLDNYVPFQIPPTITLEKITMDQTEIAVPSDLRRRIRLAHRDVRNARVNLSCVKDDGDRWIDDGGSCWERESRQCALIRLNNHLKEKSHE